MNINYNKKALKIAVLIATSLLIAGVSASTYYTMFMNATVTIGGNEITFTPGGDWRDATCTMGSGNQTVALGLQGEDGSITTIGDPVRIANSGSGSHILNLQLDTWTGDSEAGDLNYIDITLYDSVTGGSAQGTTIHLVPGGSGQVTTTGNVTIAASPATWRVQWTIYWAAGATTSGVDVHLKLSVY
jgi:hypothetical protein